MPLSRAERAKIVAQVLISSPKQDDIDAVAHFVEAVQELRASLFFIEEFRNLGIRFREGANKDEMEGRFPNPDIVSAMLIPFRRIWQKEEPCFYRRVANLLKKYEPQEAGWVDAFVFSDKTANLSKWSFLEPERLSPSEVINLWLNTRYMHTGKSHRRGKFTRKDFDQHEGRMGKDRFEYYFQVAVHEVAISFFNLGQCCEGFLLACEGRGLQPSFKLRQPLKESATRTTPGLSLRGDSPPDKLWRLKRRARYKTIAEFLSLTEFTDDHLSAVVSKATTFDELTKVLKLTMEHRDESSLQHNNAMIYISSVGDSVNIVLQKRRSRTGLLAKDQNGQLYVSGDCIHI